MTTTPSIVSAQESQKDLDAAQDLSHDTETALATLQVTTENQALGEGTTFIYPDRGELQDSSVNAEQWEYVFDAHGLFIP
ncbi:hypothetical protein BGX34_000653 [Mortierella sp. NVP85]|nr:hypothetical protein BGX34_000653 [Mortierella sp. NVP85]